MVRGVTNPPLPETGPMLFAECPLCDQPAVVDAVAGALDCPACAMRLEFADGVEAEELPLAA